MKKIKANITFAIILIIIIILEFALYKNIDIFLPTYEKELYIYEDTLKKEQKEFLFEMYEQVNLQNNYKIISSEELTSIRKNDILYNIIKNHIFNNVESDKYEKRLMTGELTNTIYGNLKIIIVKVNVSRKPINSLILYSEDMKKIYYFDIDNGTSIMNKHNEKENNEKETNEIINNCKKIFFNMIKDYEFVPDSIINKGSYYILKDSNETIVYYNSENNNIFGMYMGFNTKNATI